MYVQSLGEISLATRLRLVSDNLYAQVDEVYRQLDKSIEARWFVFLRLLLDVGPMSTTAIAKTIGTTHPAVSQLAAKMAARGLVARHRDPHDERKTLWSLTPVGRKELEAMGPIWEAIRESVAAKIERCGHDLRTALTAFEAELSASPLSSEIVQRLGERAAEQVRIERYRPELREHFYRLNAAWLGEHFEIEAHDKRILMQPERAVIERGGQIFFAVLGKTVVGTSGLERDGKGSYAVIKMSVDKAYRGRGIGRALLTRTIKEFTKLKGKRLWLETSSRLTPALQLYESMGFVRQPSRRRNKAFERSDVYMVYDPGAKRRTA